MEKDPLQQNPQQEHSAFTPAASGRDSMTTLPPPPLVLTASGPGGLEGGGGDSLTTSAAAPVTAPATAPAPAEPDGPAYSAPNAILAELSTSGASLESARQDDRNAMAGGPEVSARMAETDRRRVLAYLAAFVQVGEETGLPPALLAAIASRESRGGKHLDASGHGLSDPNGYGIMQVDERFHKVASKEGVGGLTHIRQAAGVLLGMLDGVRKKMPDWTPAMQLRGAVAAYNFNVDDVQTWDGLDRGSAHHDYSADIWERARYYASLPDFGGDGTVVAAATQAAAVGRPALRKGRLIAESVGTGGINHAEDVARVLARLQAIKVITAAEAADPDAVATYITRYQALVNDGAPDGLMEPGRKTEDRLIAGTLTRAAKPKADKKPKEKSSPRQGKAHGEVEEKALAEYRRILKETPATEAGAEDILGRGDTFAANAFADLTRMGRYDLLAALKEEVGWLDRDWMARCIAGRLSDAELAGQPKTFLAGLHTELDAGITMTDEYALMDKLDKAMGKAAAGKGGESKQTGGKAGAPKGGADSPKQPRSTRGIYVVSAADAFLRDDKLEVLPGKVLPRWADVTVTQEKTQGGKTYAYAKATDGSVEGWTAKSNLYSLDWSAKEHEKEYRGRSDKYYELMAVNDPEVTGRDVQKSGAAAKAVIDQYFPNYTDKSALDDSFRPKAEAMINGLKPHGINITINAGLRHPMRSIVFNYCLMISTGGTLDMIQEANAVCRKYGIPIDWAHRLPDGSIDLAKSKKGAGELRSGFGIKGAAARGVKDFGGNISNHNDGMAVDLKITFDFKTTKDISVGGKTYSIDPNLETKNVIDNVINTPLSKLGKEQYGITRDKKDDTVHWSVSGR